MDNIIEIYQATAQTFLQHFDEHWRDMLDTLGNHQYQLVTGNKLRPQICLWGYLTTVHPGEVSTHNFDFIANVAVSIEMVHKASLLLDDWLDSDVERHGKSAFHIDYNPQYAILFALNMIGYAMLRLEKVFPATITLPHHYYLCLDTLVKTIYSMAKGALEELQLHNDDFFNNEKILEITQLETAEIIGNSMLLGYYAGVGDKRDLQIEKMFKEIGDQCGYLFQALNDLEAFGNPKQLEKHKGSLNLDLLVHRKNLAVSALYEIANDADRTILKQASQGELLYLMNKYRVVDSMKMELNVVYKEVLSKGLTLNSRGLSNEWCEGFRWFLEYVKKFAEERLKG